MVFVILRLKFFFLVYISSYGVSEFKFSLCWGNFWDDIKLVVVLVGYNMYVFRWYDEINFFVGLGMLFVLVMFGLDLFEIWFVVLFMCLLGIGVVIF